jgi:uncharacterized membrane protein
MGDKARQLKDRYQCSLGQVFSYFSFLFTYIYILCVMVCVYVCVFVIYVQLNTWSISDVVLHFKIQLLAILRQHLISVSQLRQNVSRAFV